MAQHEASGPAGFQDGGSLHDTDYTLRVYTRYNDTTDPQARLAKETA
jgi:hypothetical protein